MPFRKEERAEADDKAWASTAVEVIEDEGNEVEAAEEAAAGAPAAAAATTAAIEAATHSAVKV